MLRITKEKLKELIVSAYESGWSGCLELKSEYAEHVLGQFEEAEDLSKSSSLTISVSQPQSISAAASLSGFYDSSATFIPGYYSYFGDTSPNETVFVNEPGDEAI